MTTAWTGGPQPSDEHMPRCAACAQPLGAWATDRLTGLLDRWGWDDKAPAVFRRAQRRWEDVALLLVDLDRFKKINDELGHPVGDRVLKAVAEVLLGCARRDDLVARCGGDEFLVMMPHTSVDDAIAVAERILDAIQALLVDVTANSGTRLTLSGLTASIGVAVHVPERTETLPDLVRDTDAALQLAKARGRGRIHVYDSTVVSRSTVEPQGSVLVDGEWVPESLALLMEGNGLLVRREGASRYELSPVAREWVARLPRSG